MGLDWVVRPRPDEPDDYDQPVVFRANKLVHSGLPDTVTRHAYSDMVPWEMESYADNLATEVELHDYDSETVTVVQNAIDWLQYWSDQEKSLYAWY